MFQLKRPCKDCPFRTDSLKGWLGRRRAEEIGFSISSQDLSFTCHKTLDQPKREQQHCAGATILLEKMDRPNQMMRIAERIGRYERGEMDMVSPVFDSIEEFVDHHDRETKA